MKKILYVYLLFSFVKYSNGDTAKASSGPYKTTIIRAGKCSQSSYPMDPDPPLTMILEVYNSSKKHSLMRGNLTVLRENKQNKLQMKRFIWQNGHWKLLSLMNNIGCHGVLFHTMMLALGVKYDRETCAYLKGQYHFRDTDVDALQHLWVSEMEYGRMLRVSEITRGYSTYTCWEFEILVEPL